MRFDNFRELRRDLEARGSRLLLTDKMSMAVREGRLKPGHETGRLDALPHDIVDSQEARLGAPMGAWLKASARR